MRIYAVWGPFRVRSGFARGPFGIRSGYVRGPREVRAGSIQVPFRISSRAIRGSFGVRSGSVRNPKPPQPKKNRSPGAVEVGAVAPPSQRADTVRFGFRVYSRTIVYLLLIVIHCLHNEGLGLLHPDKHKLEDNNGVSQKIL